ncbi:serine/arginine-rich splicing factor 3-like [Bolinopsis microptera]|uniref:serine/arginine-rich splicing factor 3-like n=1 Tax=Bolinopsis microptera TaxID=2820187 RepID=UPI00307A33EA
MAKLYIGNVDKHTDKHELETEFAKFGALREVWVARHPPGFAFVEFEDDRDAEDAIREMDDRSVCGNRIRVEWAKSNGRKPPPRDRGGFNGKRKSRSRSPPRKRRSPPPRRRSPSPRRRSPSPKRSSPRRSPRRSASPRRAASRSPRRSPDREMYRGGSPSRRGGSPRYDDYNR